MEVFLIYLRTFLCHLGYRRCDGPEDGHGDHRHDAAHNHDHHRLHQGGHGLDLLVQLLVVPGGHALQHIVQMARLLADAHHLANQRGEHLGVPGRIAQRQAGLGRGGAFIRRF